MDFVFFFVMVHWLFSVRFRELEGKGNNVAAEKMKEFKREWRLNVSTL